MPVFRDNGHAHQVPKTLRDQGVSSCAGIPGAGSPVCRSHGMPEHTSRLTQAHREAASVCRYTGRCVYRDTGTLAVRPLLSILRRRGKAASSWLKWAWCKRFAPTCSAPDEVVRLHRCAAVIREARGLSSNEAGPQKRKNPRLQPWVLLRRHRSEPR